MKVCFKLEPYALYALQPKLENLWGAVLRRRFLFSKSIEFYGDVWQHVGFGVQGLGFGVSGFGIGEVLGLGVSAA